MPTPVGFLILVVSLLGGVAAWIWGLPALFLAATVGIALLVLSLTLVNLPIRVRYQRTLTPARVSVGGSITVNLRFQGRRSRFWRTVVLQEYSQEDAPEVKVLGEMPAGSYPVARYQLKPQRRGVLEVGPLDLRLTDPFDLARRVYRAEGGAGIVSRTLIWPQFADISLPSAISESPGASHNRQAKPVPAAEEEFAGLREYALGDDPRKIHWLSSARHRELMVRLLEHEFLEEAVVYLEIDRKAAREETFEEMVSAAASLVLSCCKHFHRTHLLTRSGSLTVGGYNYLGGHVTPLLDSLALLTQLNVAPSSVPWYPRKSNATLFAVLGELTEGEYGAWSKPQRGSGRRYVVQFAESGHLRGEPGVVCVRRGEKFAECWHKTLFDVTSS